jgi:endonuclease/exonuclease/phosphatase family metal-dependent hydrolase
MLRVSGVRVVAARRAFCLLRGLISGLGLLFFSSNPVYAGPDGNAGLIQSNSHSALSSFNIAALNTEWLWTPHDGIVDGSRFNKGDMSPAAYRAELEFYRSMIDRNQIDILVVSEIENEQVAQELARTLGSPWRYFFINGRDTATGQDVAVLSRLPLLSAEASTFGFPSGSVKGYSKPKRLSKVLGVSMRLETQMGEQSLGVITSHFLSKRNENDKKAAKRLMQSEALVKAILEYSDHSSVVVLGDFNDVSYSPVIKTLEQKGQLNNAQTSCVSSTVEPKKMRYLIDHILFRGLKCEMYTLLDTLDYSDHPAVMATFTF